ncbi:hypothetical protein N7449_012082 [Penicillium cf. viridicatum]|uniref:Uncharacterized protein n=1 Tax=Penicillium cf. viridicatum TaxID=2972119 RepID=A0A9W9IRV6_9EURO|nr:hypothetical protein N7449_012082 [Penicillium cf. viridicatum]
MTVLGLVMTKSFNRTPTAILAATLIHHLHYFHFAIQLLTAVVPLVNSGISQEILNHASHKMPRSRWINGCQLVG